MRALIGASPISTSGSAAPTAKLTADGRTMLRASYGRFNQGVLTGELAPIHPGMTPITTTAFDPATGGYTRPVSVVDSRINLRLDPETRPPHTAEYSIGLDREIELAQLPPPTPLAEQFTDGPVFAHPPSITRAATTTLVIDSTASRRSKSTT